MATRRPLVLNGAGRAREITAGDVLLASAFATSVLAGSAIAFDTASTSNRLFVRDNGAGAVSIDAVVPDNSAYAPLYFRGTGMLFNGAQLWHASNFDPAAKVNRAGDTLTGGLTFNGAASVMNLLSQVTGSIVNTQSLGGILGGDASSYQAGMYMRANEAWTSTAKGSQLHFQATAAGTTTRADAATLSAAGLIVVGSVTGNGVSSTGRPNVFSGGRLFIREWDTNQEYAPPSGLHLGLQMRPGVGGRILSYDYTNSVYVPLLLDTTALTVNGSGTFITSNSGATLTVRDTGSAGANLLLVSGAATAPNKTLRAFNDNLEFINSAYNGVMAYMTDAGRLFTYDGYGTNANIAFDYNPGGSRLLVRKDGSNVTIDSVTNTNSAFDVMRFRASQFTFGADIYANSMYASGRVAAGGGSNRLLRILSDSNDGFVDSVTADQSAFATMQIRASFVTVSQGGMRVSGDLSSGGHVIADGQAFRGGPNSVILSPNVGSGNTVGAVYFRPKGFNDTGGQGYVAPNGDAVFSGVLYPSIGNNSGYIDARDTGNWRRIYNGGNSSGFQAANISPGSSGPNDLQRAAYIATGTYGGGYSCKDDAGNGVYYAGFWTTTNRMEIGVSAPGANNVANPMRIYADGTVTAVGNMQGYASDARLKRAPRPYSPREAADILRRLTIQEFDWDFEAIERLHPGFIPDAPTEVGMLAQHAEATLASMVFTHDSAAQIKGIRWEKSQPYVIAVVQDLLNRVEALEHA